MNIITDMSASVMILDLAFAVLMVAVGAAAGWWLHRLGGADAAANAQRAQQALAKLRELATSVAADVGEHTTRVREINTELSTAAGEGGSLDDLVLSSVATIINANERLQGQLASAEVKLQQQAEEIQTQLAVARTDALTGLNNRRAFDDEINRRFAEWQRRKTTFSLLMIDVDFFKKFNDTHGHQAGDAVLKGVAATLKQTMREMDLVARYGGEEFAAVLPVTNLQEAMRAAERARAAINGATFNFEGKDLRVTASIGIAQIMPTDTTGLMVKRADEALYESKNAGRNCVSYHDGQACQAVAAQPAAAEAAAAVAPPARTKPAAATIAEPAVFRASLNRRIAECQSYQTPLSLVLVDVDQYQDLYERMGPAVAELVIETIAGVLTSSVGKTDTVERLSKGQFVVSMPGTRLHSALEAAERTRASIAASAMQLRGAALRLTISQGIAETANRDDAEALLKHADAALFACKAAGRNCTHIYRDGSCEAAQALAAVG